MVRRILILCSVLLFTLVAGAGCSQEKKPVPEENSASAKYTTLSEAAADDPYPKGCVSCHKKTSDVDRSLPVYVKRIEGHPDVSESTITACYKCHEAEKDYNKYKAFYRGIHEAHWKSTAFYGQSKGQCYSCHTVESNGVSGLKEYPLAGYRSGIGASSGSTSQSNQQSQSQTQTENKKQSGTSSQSEQKKTEENQTEQKQTEEQKQQNQQEQGGQTSQGNIPEDILPGIVDIPTPTP